jgi:hypothetical protein
MVWQFKLQIAQWKFTYSLFINEHAPLYNAVGNRITLSSATAENMVKNKPAHFREKNSFITLNANPKLITYDLSPTTFFVFYIFTKPKPSQTWNRMNSSNGD